jgi:hypothetical protein
MIEKTEQHAINITIYNESIPIWSSLMSKLSRVSKKVGFSKKYEIEALTNDEIALINELKDDTNDTDKSTGEYTD